MPCQKRECPKEKSSERSQILSCRESMSMPRPVIGSTSQQYVIRPSDAKTQTSNANLSKTNIKHDITYCTSDTCRNSSSCIKILPKYCPYGLKKDSDSVACPGPCRESINGNELNNFVYRHSVTSLPEVNAESLMKLTNACPAGQEISSLPCKSLAPVMPNPTDKDRINRKSLQKSGLKESMQTSSAECSECNSEGELPLRKAPCCPDVDFDVIADVGRLSQEYICPSLKSYLDKQTSNQNCNKQKPFDCSTTKPSTISKGNVKSTSCTVTAADQPNSSEPSCPAVCQSRDFDHIGNLEQRISVSVPGKSSCCSNNQQSSLKLTSTDLGAGQEYCQNDSRIAPMARRSQLPEKLENRHYSINEPKKIDMISPCTRESFPCCETSTRKSGKHFIKTTAFEIVFLQ